MIDIRRVKRFLLLEVGLPLADFRFGTQAHTTYHQIREMNEWSKEQIKAWQDQKVRELVEHYYTNTVYYRNLLDSMGLTPADIQTREDLVKIPPITKEIIKENYNGLIPANIQKIPHKQATTGGSSGKTLKYLLDLRSWSYTTAIKIYSWETCGYKYGDTFASVGSSSLFPQKISLKYRLYHFFKNSVRINALNLSDERIANDLVLLKKKKVKYLYGYAGGLYLIARYMNQRGIKIESIKGCFPTAEMLTEEYRHEMERAFGYVMDCYGARDSGITAYEITPGRYHVGYNSVAEVVNCYAENTGTLLVTDLLSYSFPFIRYDLGDDATLEDDAVYNGQLITKIWGRSPDIIRLDNGHVLTGPGFQLMFGRLHVSAYRISKVNGLKLQVEYQPGEDFTEKEKKLLMDTLKNHAGQDCEIIIKKVDEFTPNKNGKRNYFMA
ncbi:phenylacetate--CoA ligase family protein [Rhabdobacter roseus]|uniref:Phenylacetate-CoA ligase n=1 Tax=Rhabdobacter roseus TaxID=1655419 RepID=A0A840TTC7_9BACT|nr:phenylacetate--CoA ligase family protein [Rhabdobacter roseus]MBB5283250.1 phenylacetate-CoA ligase [Rhabdobacter roseus]